MLRGFINTSQYNEDLKLFFTFKNSLKYNLGGQIINKEGTYILKIFSRLIKVNNDSEIFSIPAFSLYINTTGKVNIIVNDIDHIFIPRYVYKDQTDLIKSMEYIRHQLPKLELYVAYSSLLQTINILSPDSPIVVSVDANKFSLLPSYDNSDGFFNFTSGKFEYYRYKMGYNYIIGSKSKWNIVKKQYQPFEKQIDFSNEDTVYSDKGNFHRKLPFEWGRDRNIEWRPGRAGWHNDKWYDAEGYDEDGYDMQGYDREGYNRQGIDIDGYDREGYDVDGLPREINEEYLVRNLPNLPQLILAATAQAIDIRNHVTAMALADGTVIAEPVPDEHIAFYGIYLQITQLHRNVLEYTDSISSFNLHLEDYIDLTQDIIDFLNLLQEGFNNEANRPDAIVLFHRSVALSNRFNQILEAEQNDIELFKFLVDIGSIVVSLYAILNVYEGNIEPSFNSTAFASTVTRYENFANNSPLEFAFSRPIIKILNESYLFNNALKQQSISIHEHQNLILYNPCEEVHKIDSNDNKDFSCFDSFEHTSLCFLAGVTILSPIIIGCVSKVVHHPHFNGGYIELV